MEAKDKKVNPERHLSIVSLSNYEAPKLVESYGGDDKYITYGPNNSYFTHINECFNGSSTNRAVISSIAQMIYGKGLDFIGSDEKEATLKEIQKLLPVQDMRLLAIDFKEYGQCALQIGYNKDHTKILVVQHQPIMTLAIGKMTRMGQITKYWYCPDFANTSVYPPKSIPAFGTSKRQVEILYIQNYTYSSGLLYYANVDYQSALQYCKAEEEISNYHINNIRNGFSPSMLLTFRDGKPAAPEQLAIEQKVKDKWGGSSKAGSIMIAFVEDGETAPTMEAIQLNDADKQYQFVTDLAENKILVSHRVTSKALLGINTSSGFSSTSDELKTGYQLFNITVINPFQEILIDSIQKILHFNGIEEDLYFKSLMPIEFTDGGLEATKDVDAVLKETGVQLEQTTTVSKEKELKKA